MFRLLAHAVVAFHIFASGAHAETAHSGAVPTVTLLAAASLTDAVTAIGRTIETDTGMRLRLSFAASSTLARQIAAGAPADIFISANPAWMDDLDARGLTASETRRDFATNRLVLIAPALPRPPWIGTLAETDIAALLPPGGRLAVGDPAHVPAGIYARQALQSLGQWQSLEPHLAPADNVRAALALVAAGEARLGIVYATDARATDAVSVLGTFPDRSHDLIRYPAAVLSGRTEAHVLAVFARLFDEDAIRILADHGFLPPERS